MSQFSTMVSTPCTVRHFTSRVTWDASVPHADVKEVARQEVVDFVQRCQDEMQHPVAVKPLKTDYRELLKQDNKEGFTPHKAGSANGVFKNVQMRETVLYFEDYMLSYFSVEVELNSGKKPCKDEAKSIFRKLCGLSDSMEEIEWKMGNLIRDLRKMEC